MVFLIAEATIAINGLQNFPSRGKGHTKMSALAESCMVKSANGSPKSRKSISRLSFSSCEKSTKKGTKPHFANGKKALFVG
jgi:hypothetical protein